MIHKLARILTFSFLFSGLVFFNSSCTKEENSTSTTQSSEFYSQTEINDIVEFMSNQTDLVYGELDMTGFPKPDFTPPQSQTEQEILDYYFNGMMYLNDAEFTGKEMGYTFEDLKARINADSRIDQAGKTYLFSAIQISEQLFPQNKFKEEVNNNISFSDARGCKDCSGLYSTYQVYSTYCQLGFPGYCSAAQNYYSQYIACLNSTIHCPNGFTYDGANCYSGVHFPSGYNGFIYGNGFYVQQNCGISTANNCCPNGFGYDGANCHYWGLYFPSSYEPFIYNNAFYVKAKCY